MSGSKEDKKTQGSLFGTENLPDAWIGAGSITSFYPSFNQPISEHYNGAQASEAFFKAFSQVNRDISSFVANFDKGNLSK